MKYVIYYNTYNISYVPNKYKIYVIYMIDIYIYIYNIHIHNTYNIIYDVYYTLSILYITLYLYKYPSLYILHIHH